MAYTFILISRANTSQEALHVDVGRPLLWTVVSLLILSPFLLAGLGYYVLFPGFERVQAALGPNYEALSTEHEALKQAYTQLATEKEQLTEQLQGVRAETAAIVAKAAIQTTTETAAQTRLQDLERTVLDLEKKLQFYSDLVQPANNRRILTCYNLTAENSAQGFRYSVNWVRSDNGTKTAATAKVRFRLLTGADALNMSDPERAPVLKIQDMPVDKDSRLVGEIRANIPKSGIRILDVRAYGPNETLLGNCWTSF